MYFCSNSPFFQFVLFRLTAIICIWQAGTILVQSYTLQVMVARLQYGLCVDELFDVLRACAADLLGADCWDWTRAKGSWLPLQLEERTTCGSRMRARWWQRD